MRIETGDAMVNGSRLYYETAGSGTPALFIHGNFADRRHWDDQFPVFAEKHRAIRYDVRGFGKSALLVTAEHDVPACVEVAAFCGITRWI
jgi:pimeloyl-ACP methyl ester carboxylesterase